LARTTTTRDFSVRLGSFSTAALLAGVLPGEFPADRVLPQDELHPVATAAREPIVSRNCRRSASIRSPDTAKA
jgi:hypothetical protein